MNKKYKKILATGIALNMTLINIPYNVFANSDIIEEILTNDDNILLDDDVNLKNEGKDNFINNDDSVDNEIIIENPELNIENNSSFIDISINKNLVNEITSYTEDKKNTKSTAPSVTNYADSFAGGDGTKENPYQISNAKELSRLAYLVNEEKINTANMYFELISDIDLSNFNDDNDDSNGNWTPIGYSEKVTPYTRYYFKGIFDGNNYKISNMSINSNLQSVGLFGYTSNATIKNVNLSNVSVTGYNNISALIGFAEGNTTLENISININSMTTSATSFIYVGGLVGFSMGIGNTLSIDNCDVIFNNKISINSSSLGGFIGYHSGGISVTNSSIKGNLDSSSYVGGIIANYNNNNNENIVKFDNINIELDIISQNSNIYGGGIAGFFYYPDTSNSVELSNINFKGSLIGGKNSYLGGLFANLSTYSSNTTNVNISNCNIEIMDLKGFKGGGAISIIIGSNNKYNFNDINVYIKGEIDVIYEMGGLVGNSSSALNVDSLNVIIKQPLLKPSVNVGGVVGWLDNDLILNNSDINFNISLDDNDTNYSKSNYLKIGGIVGLQYCNVLNIINTAINMNVDLEDYPYAHIGGFAGLLSGNSDNDVSIIQSTHKGSLNGQYVGGISGESSLTQGKIENCYLIGNKKANVLADGIFNLSDYVKKATLDINNFYIVGNIEDSNFSKKIFNFLDKDVITANIKNTYYDNSILNKKDENLIGLTTEQMQGINAKDNMPFDYDNIWKLNKEYYPTFNQLNTAPELSGSDIELILNQDYDLLDYITIEDFEDKDLVPEIVTDLDITKIGNYTATFKVTDSKGLSDELTLNIKVIMENPIINAQDIEIFVGDEFDEKKDVTATDVDGSDITEHIKVIENTVNTKVPGVYKVIYEIESLYKSPIQKEIKVIVKEKAIINDDKDKDNNNKNETSTSTSEDNKNNSSTEKPQTGDFLFINVISIIISFTSLYLLNNKKEDL